MDTRVARHLMQRLNRDAERIAARFGLRYRCIEPESANVKRRYGICYDDGSIRIRLAHVVSGHPLRYSSLVDTLCHELAHLRRRDGVALLFGRFAVALWWFHPLAWWVERRARFEC